MGAYSDFAERPEVPAEKRKKDENIKMIRKLRWMGLQDEAFQLERRLAGSVSRGAIRFGPVDTD